MTTPSARLLLIDDDAGLAALLKDFVSGHGFELDWADRPSEGRRHLEQDPDLILLDVMLPEQDGFSLCADLRAEGVRTPILMLTARGDDQDRIRGLRTGADDYLPKPFNPLELVARVEAILRRAVPAAPPAGVGVDRDRSAMRLKDKFVPLTPTEFRLMEAMTAAPGRVFSRSQLLELMDEAGASESFDRAIDIHVSRLRGKIEKDARRPAHLITVRGLGYRWEW